MAEENTQETSAAAQSAPQRSNRAQALVGRVVSSKMDKTITVLVERRVPHPLYKKYVRRSTKYHVHDEANESREGDTVSITECRPISKTKAWRLESIIERAR